MATKANKEQRTVPFGRGCKLSPMRKCHCRVSPIRGTGGVFGAPWCKESAVVFCPYRVIDVPVLGWINDLPVIAAGVDPAMVSRQKWTAYLKAAGEYDVMPDIGIDAMMGTYKFAADYQRMQVPWALVLRARRANGVNVYSLYKRLPRRKSTGIVKPPKIFQPVNGHRGEAAALLRFGKCRGCP